MKTFHNLTFGLSTKKDGNMRLFLNGDNSIATGNRWEFFANQGINPDYVVSADLAHGSNIYQVEEKDRGQIIPACDGLITNCRNVFLAITAADCAPIFLCDYEKRVVAVVHAGWQGACSGITEKVVRLFAEKYNSQLDNIRVLIGPHIRPCHFEVKSDVSNRFPPEFLSSDPLLEKTFLDLGGALKKQLTEVGLSAGNIAVSPECTYCLDKKYFSFRRDKPSKIEAVIAFMGVKV